MPEPTLSPATPPATPAAASTASATGVPRPDEDVTTTLYRAAIGPVNPDFYLPIFARFEAADRAGLSWNTAAGLLTFNWLVYRQLWGAALGYAGIVLSVVLLVFGIGRLVFQLSDNLTMALSLGLGLAAIVLPGLLGNALLQKECRKRMAKALASHAVLAEACLDLQRQSSSRLRMLWVAMANMAVLGIVAFAYVQLSTLGSLAVMPQGALEAGQVAPGLATSSSSPVVAASTPTTPASAPVAPVAAASAPETTASTATPAAVAASAPVVAASVPAAALSAPQAAVSAPLAASGKADAKVPTKAASAAQATPTTPEALYYINVGLFSKPQNAARVHTQLLEARLPSVMKELKTAKERQIRVRVGPFATEEQAEAAAQKIRTLKFDAGIIQQ